MKALSMQSVMNPATALAAGTGPAARAGGTAPRFGMTMWFNVIVPDLDRGTGASSLGYWSGCSGLEVQLTPEGPFVSGGDDGTPRYLPGQVTYKPIVLQRAMTGQGSVLVRQWLERLTRAAAQGGGPDGNRHASVTVELRSGLGRQDTVIHRWVLKDAFPVAWAAPALSTSGGGVAVETLTLAHS